MQEISLLENHTFDKLYLKQCKQTSAIKDIHSAN